MIADPFPADLPYNEARAQALRVYAQILRENPDCHRETVVVAMTHWLRCTQTLSEIAAHIKTLDGLALKLSTDAKGLVDVQRGITEGMLAAACRRN